MNAEEKNGPRSPQLLPEPESMKPRVLDLNALKAI